jgi:hypothetical protein
VLLAQLKWRGLVVRHQIKEDMLLLTMARPLRLELAGALYHVTSRGGGPEDIFLGDEDRLVWPETKAYLSGQHTLAQIAAHFHVHYTTVSSLVKAHEAGMSHWKSP